MDKDKNIRPFRKIGEREIAFLGITASRSRVMPIEYLQSVKKGNWSKIIEEMDKLGLREKENK